MNSGSCVNLGAIHNDNLHTKQKYLVEVPRLSSSPQNYSVQEILRKLSALWKKKAAVNNRQLDYSELEFNFDLNDFSESLLPFKDHDAWKSAPTNIKSQCLSYAWAIYNMKTIYIECDIVTPACEDIIKSPPIGGRNRYLLQDVMAEAMLDEALHTKMSIGACNYIYEMRGIVPLNFNEFNLISWKNNVLGQCSAEWERRLTRFGIACASETLITDYLKLMSEDESIQSICQQVTRTHAVDEWSHSSVFSYAAIEIIHGLSRSEREYLKKLIPKTVEMFADNEMKAWEAVFSMVNFPNYVDIIEDSHKLGEIDIYQGSVDSLLQRIGLDN